jgi:hypothetical protein
VWRILWQLKIPSKVKIFLWRSLHGIVPLKSILVNRHIGTTSGCPICNSGPKDVLHLLFCCPVAKELWSSLGLLDIFEEAAQVDRAGSAVLEEIFKRHDNVLQGSDDIGLKEVI